tara:strand:- start:145 stop:312 length:168 start_codon:yes stop_codon:yes gene_type:complete
MDFLVDIDEDLYGRVLDAVSQAVAEEHGMEVDYYEEWTTDENGRMGVNLSDENGK